MCFFTILRALPFYYWECACVHVCVCMRVHVSLVCIIITYLLLFITYLCFVWSQQKVADHNARMWRKINGHQLYTDASVVLRVADIHREIYSDLPVDKHTNTHIQTQTETEVVVRPTWHIIGYFGDKSINQSINQSNLALVKRRLNKVLRGASYE